MKSKSTSMHVLSLTLMAGAVAAALATSAQAAENRAQRYTAGLGGSDLTSMLVPGWYGQVAMIHYHATKLKGNDGKDAIFTGTQALPNDVALATADGMVPSGTPNRAAVVASTANTIANGLNLAGYTGLRYQSTPTNFRADAYVLLPRITYLSTSKFLGAHLGFTAMLPLLERQTSLSALTTINATDQARLAAGLGGTPTAVTGAQNTANLVKAGVDAQIAGRSGSNAGFGDLEMAPILNWEIGDHQTVTFTPTVIFPTGEYDKNNAVNPGFGKYYTFRPSVQYGFIGDGWDVGARAVLSFNTRNTETDYRSGNMFNLDFALMKFVTEDLRLGLQGYVVQQFSKDTSDNVTEQAAIDAEGGRKMRVYGLGPALAWIVNGGEMMVEGKVIQEFGARNRAEGATYMLTVSKPFGL